MLNKMISKEEAKQINGLILAYIGDAIYEIFVRENLVFDYPNQNVFELHKKAIKTVNCISQAETLNKLIAENVLTDEEIYIVKRGKNCKSHSIPKNADRKTYMEATGFEALIGFLYLTDRERLEQVLGRYELRVKS